MGVRQGVRWVGRCSLWPNEVWPRRFTKFGQTLFGQHQVWPGPTLASTKFGQYQVWPDFVFKVRGFWGPGRVGPGEGGPGEGAVRVGGAEVVGGPKGWGAPKGRVGVGRPQISRFFPSPATA